VRWGVVALISLGTIINYMSRNTLAVLAPQLESQLRFGVREYSYVVAAFQLAYTVMQPVCGVVLDRLGSRTGFALFALLWSAAGLAHAGASGWQGLAVARGALGASEAAAVPAGMKAISEWFKGADRSKAVGWFNAGTSLGAMLAPPVAVGLSVAFGWRSAFLVTAVLGAAWAGLWFALYRAPDGERPARPRARGRGLAALGERRFWALALPRFLAEPAWQTFNFWVPLYLATERKWDLQHIALYAWAPFFAADLGGVAAGYLSPALMRRFGLDLLPARTAVVWLGAILMTAPGFVALVGDATAAVALLCVGGFAHQAISVSINTLSADLFASGELAAANGLVGSAGWLGGLIFSLLIGQTVQVSGFGPLFACLGAFDIVGAVLLATLLRGLAPVREGV
jgi:ACS family hexuronate transporter-like MFS transporter